MNYFLYVMYWYAATCFHTFCPNSRRDTVCGSVRSVTASQAESGRVSRADTEGEPSGKLTGRDKTTLAWLWCLSFLYGMMTDQLVSKVVDRPCGVREQLSTNLERASVLFGLVLPFLVGR